MTEIENQFVAEERQRGDIQERGSAGRFQPLRTTGSVPGKQEQFAGFRRSRPPHRPGPHLPVKLDRRPRSPRPTLLPRNLTSFCRTWRTSTMTTGTRKTRQSEGHKTRVRTCRISTVEAYLSGRRRNPRSVLVIYLSNIHRHWTTSNCFQSTRSLVKLSRLSHVCTAQEYCIRLLITQRASTDAAICNRHTSWNFR